MTSACSVFQGSPVLRIDSYYLYRVGSAVHPLTDLKGHPTPDGRPADNVMDLILKCAIAENSLEGLLSRSVFNLKTVQASGANLLLALRQAREKVSKEGNFDREVLFVEVFQVKQCAEEFENILSAEMALIPVYVIAQKAGFDTAIIIEEGQRCFPADLALKTPNAIHDIRQATRCIAMELFTAAGFHLHRANEAVLRAYWDANAGGEAKPNSRNMGEYLNKMDKLNIGKREVRASLRDLKDLHRNPLIHPEHIIDNADMAIALMNSIHNAITQMLREIPTPPEAQQALSEAAST